MNKKIVGRPPVEISLEYLKEAHAVYMQTKSLRKSAEYLSIYGIRASKNLILRRFDEHGLKRLKLSF